MTAPTSPMSRRGLPAVLLAMAAAMASCSRDAGIDLRPAFERLKAGQSLEEVRGILRQPLATPASQREALGFSYLEYRLVDPHSSYELQFMAAPTTQPHLVSKAAKAHLP